MIAPQGNLSFFFFWEHGFFFFFWAINFKILLKGNLFSSISFVDEKENLGKGSNLRSLGCKKNFNHYISFFPLKIM
jgi:hypothetical protein